MEDKKGEMAIGTIIAIILGIVVLVLSIYAVIYYKGIFYDRTSEFVGEVNVDVIKEACLVALTSGNEYSLCCQKREVNYLDGDKIVENEMTCFELGERFNFKKLKEVDCDEIIC